MIKMRILLLVFLFVLCCEFQLTSGKKKKGFRKRIREKIKAIQGKIDAVSKTLMKFMLDTEERFMRTEKAIQCLKYPNGCPNCEPKASCLKDPCEGAICVGYPDAKCKANYCGGCNTDWTVNGEPVKCKTKEYGK